MSDAARLLADYSEHLEVWAEQLERGEDPTEDHRRACRDFDVGLRAAASGLLEVASGSDGPAAVARWKAADVRYRSALQARMAEVAIDLASSGRSRLAHRAYRGEEPAPAAFYVLQRS